MRANASLTLSHAKAPSITGTIRGVRDSFFVLAEEATRG